MQIYVSLICIYTMANLFDFGDVKNHPRRSGFDLQRRNAFTAKAGELLPVYCRLTYPGDSFRLGIQSFTRTMPVNTAAFTRIREYFNWYWVPLRLLNKNLAPSLVKMYNQPVQATGITSNRSIIDSLPYTSLSTLNSLIGQGLNTADSGNSSLPSIKNAFGFFVSSCSAKLIQYFRYGNFLGGSNSTCYGLYDKNGSNNFSFTVNYNLNILPFLAYQKIYNDYFRFEQWEKQVPYTYNVDFYQGGNILSSLNTLEKQHDYMSSANYFTLRYVNWNKDMFMGVMPDTQLGEVASIGAAGAPSQVFAYDSSKAIKYPLKTVLPQGDAPGYVNPATPILQATDPTNLPTNSRLPIMSQAASSQFNILQLRMAEAVQKYREVSQCADQDYRGQIKAHFGVNLSSAFSDQCIYIGGHAGNIDISEVVNTNLSSDNEATIQGKGVGTSQGYENFSCDEHGILMCLYYVKPILDYVITAPWKEWTYTNVDDLPFPEFDSIGMESLPLALLSNASTAFGNVKPNATSTFGYVPRYIELKTDIDDINGAFRNSLRSWVTAIDPQVLSEWFKNSIYENNQIQLNYNFFKVNPKILDSIFVRMCDSTCDSDQFLVNAVFDVKAVRNFDYDGMPY